MNKPDAILTGDWHLREDQPVCRTDDFWEMQWKQVDFVANLQATYDCPVLCSGDLFHHWKPSPNLISKAMAHMPHNFYTVYGNHCLPQHNLDLAYKSGVFTLLQAGKIKLLMDVHWGQTPNAQSGRVWNDRKILVWHVMTYIGELPWPGCVDTKAHQLLRRYSTYDLILTGHNHKSFTVRSSDRLLVNPGSLNRQSADQIDHKPAVWLWYAKTNTVTPAYIPINNGAVSREHIDIQTERDDRIAAFVTHMNRDWKADLSFEDNLERHLQSNKTKKSIKNLIYKSLET